MWLPGRQFAGLPSRLSLLSGCMVAEPFELIVQLPGRQVAGSPSRLSLLCGCRVARLLGRRVV